MEFSNFQTLVEIPDYEWKTGYTKKNIFLGSCFTENVGNKMAALKYNVDINPFGILYNPVSVGNSIRFLLDEREFSKSDLIQHNGLWHSFYHHGKFSSQDEQTTLQSINNRISTSAKLLKSADFLFITFGTAWIYKYKKTGQTVSNCHKISAQKFERIRLSADEITLSYKQIISELLEFNPNIKVIFTVSPIRHWKDGAIENQRSKSSLLLAIDEIIKYLGNNSCSYFPTYEIVMDELRDYRFYSDDMIHISEVAINHIWKKFEHCLIDDKSCKEAVLVQKIINAKNHRPFNKFSTEHFAFLNKSLKQTILLKQHYPYLNLKLEKEYFIDEMKKIEKHTNRN